MPGVEYSANVRVQIHILSSMSVLGSEIKHSCHFALICEEQGSVGQHGKLSRSDVEVSCQCPDLNIYAQPRLKHLLYLLGTVLIFFGLEYRRNLQPKPRHCI
jgi:hypothetical protein